jgi:hypothetical protein
MIHYLDVLMASIVSASKVQIELQGATGDYCLSEHYFHFSSLHSTQM